MSLPAHAFMKERFSGRKGRLIKKFREMKSGDELRIGIAAHAKSDIYAAAGLLGMLVTVMKTEEKVEGENGIELPVFLVSFR